MIQAWSLLFVCCLLSASLGQEGQGVFLRIKKKYLEEEIARHLVNSSLGEQITNLVNGRIKRPRHGAERAFFGYYLFIPPRMKVKTPYLPVVKITKPANDSLKISLRVVFSIYFELSFDVLSNSVEIQVVKNFSVILSRSSDGFKVKTCRSCKGFMIAQTLYKSSNISKEGATPMVKSALQNNLAPVLDERACDLLPEALFGPSGKLLNDTFFDLSPPGIQFSVRSTHLKEGLLVLELNVPGGDGETEEETVDFLESLPQMHGKTVADIAMTEKQMDRNFARLLHPMKTVVLDKDHEMIRFLVDKCGRGHILHGKRYIKYPHLHDLLGTSRAFQGFCVLENVPPLLLGEVSHEEIADYFVNITSRGPPGFYTAFWGVYVNHPIRIDVFNTKELGIPVWTRIDVYSLVANASVLDNKLEISLIPNSGFLDMLKEHGNDPYELLIMLEKALDLESPLAQLESLQQEFPLPLAAGVEGTVEMRIQHNETYLLISVISN